MNICTVDNDLATFIGNDILSSLSRKSLSIAVNFNSLNSHDCTIVIVQHSTAARVIATTNDLTTSSTINNFQHTIVCNNVGIGIAPIAVSGISFLRNSFAVQINDYILPGLNYQTSNRICCTHGEVSSKFSLLS